MSAVVVTGVDGSDTAARASGTAARVATALGAKLVVVTAVEKAETEQVGAPGDEHTLSSGELAEKIADQAVRELKTEFPDLAIEGRAAQGKPADALVDVAEELDASLIVVGNKRVQGVARVLGSIATDVAHKAPCDVYIAHTHSKP